jgi:hypothetical protein
MTEENTTPEAEGGFLGGLLGKAKEFGEKAKDLAEDAIEHVKDFTEDLPENAKKITDETVASVKKLVDGDAPTEPPAPTA